jgi:hypothetical protein
MPAIEELEQRVARLETLFEDVLKEKITHISARLDQLYEKTERDKTELLEKIANLYAKTEKDKAEILVKTDKDKRELIYWIVGLMLGFSTLTITAIWAILSFALKQ